MGTGSNYAGNLSTYLSPYTNDVVNATQAQFNNQNAQSQQGIISNAVDSGAFGGDRASVAQGIAAGQEASAQAPIIAQLENQGYTNAQGELNTQQQIGQNAAGTNLSAANTGVTGSTNSGSLGNSLLNFFNSQQSSQLGANEASSQLANQAGAGLANLGNEAQSTSLNGANASMTAGGLEQQLEQSQLNVPYEQFEQQQAYPYQATNWLSGLDQSLGSAAGGTSTQTAPGASGTSQALGAATSLAGIGSLTGAFGDSGYLAALALLQRGGAIKRESGGSIPDVSISYIPSASNQSKGMGIPSAARASGAQQSSSSQALGSLSSINSLMSNGNSPVWGGGSGIASSVPQSALSDVASGAAAFEQRGGAIRHKPSGGGIVTPFRMKGRGILKRDAGGATNSSANQINQLFEQDLARSPSSSDLQYYQGLLNSGTSIDQIGKYIQASPEASGVADAGQINQMFEQDLGRAPTGSDQQYYEGLISNGTSLDQVGKYIQASPESQTNARGGQSSNAQFINQQYQSLLGRAPDLQGQQYYQGLMSNGTSPSQIQQYIEASPEYQQNQSSATGSQFTTPKQAGNGVFIPQLKTGTTPTLNLPANLLSDYGSSGTNLPHTTYTPPVAPWTTAGPSSVSTSARGGVPHKYATDGAVDDDDDIDYDAIGSGITGTPTVNSVAAYPVDAAPDDTTHNVTGNGVTYAPPPDNDNAGTGIYTNTYKPRQASNLGQKNASNASGMGLLAAGLGIMAGRSPNTLVNIGQGGLEGLKTYQQVKSQGEAQQDQNEQQANEDSYKKANLDMQAQHFSDTIQQAKKQLQQQGEYQTGEQALRKAQMEQTAQQQQQDNTFRSKQLSINQQQVDNSAPDKYDTVIPKLNPDGSPAKDGDGNPLATYLDTDTGDMKVMPYDPTRGGKVGMGPRMSDSAIEDNADRVIAGDNSGLTRLSEADRVAIQNRAADKLTAQGKGGIDVVANSVDLGGQKAGARTLGTRTATLELANNEFQQMAPLALQASGNVNRGQYPNLNAVENAISTGTGDENIVRLNAATNSLVNIYARAINPSGVPTDSDKAHARDILNNGFSKGQYSAAVDQLNKEIQAARQSPGAVRSDMRASITGQQPASQPAAAKTPKYQEGQIYTDAKGNKAQYINGQFVPVQ
jgi:hypothetical protein